MLIVLWGCSFALSSFKLLWQQEIPAPSSPLQCMGEREMGPDLKAARSPKSPFSCRTHPNSPSQTDVTLKEAAGAGAGAAGTGRTPWHSSGFGHLDAANPLML